MKFYILGAREGVLLTKDGFHSTVNLLYFAVKENPVFSFYKSVQSFFIFDVFAKGIVNDSWFTLVVYNCTN